MASIEPIFRSIDVGENLQLTLDAPIPPDVMQLMQPAGPNRYQMRPGTFHRAESITVEVAEDQNVQQMDFTYDPGTSYHELYEDYRKDLGDPVQDNPDAPAAERRSVWEDAVTRFELFAQGPRRQIPCRVHAPEPRSCGRVGTRRGFSGSRRIGSHGEGPGLPISFTCGVVRDLLSG